MFDAAWLNMGSLVLGLMAWILPAITLVWRDKVNSRRFAVFPVASLSACAISLCMQIFYTDYLVKTEDWSALMDTSSAVAFVSAVLLAVTILLNAVALGVRYKK